MGEPKKKNVITNESNHANADTVSLTGTAALTPPEYNVDTYKDDKSKHDPMDLLGTHLSTEILVPHNASPTEKFYYYKAILNSIGQDISIEPGNTHILALRGVIRDGEGNIIQTASAARYQGALHGLGQLSEQHHFSDSRSARYSESRLHDTMEGEGTWNDMIIILSVDENKNAVAHEKIGSVDPAKTGDKMGSAHMMDGTFEYGFGLHRTDKERHLDTIAEMRNLAKSKKWEIAKNKGIFKTGRSGKKTTYGALVPKKDLHILRDNVQKEHKDWDKRKESDGFFTEEDYQKYNKYNKTHKMSDRHKFFGKRAATNGHVGGDDESFSEGCWNLPLKEFMEMMSLLHKQKEIQGVRQSKFRVNYTLLDASKVGFKLVKHEDQTPELEKRDDYAPLMKIIDEFSEWI